MRRRRRAGTILSATALLGLAAAGAGPIAVIYGSIGVLVLKDLLFDARGRQFPIALLQVLHTLLGAVLLCIAFFLANRLEPLTMLVGFATPFLVLRNFAEDTPFRDFLIVLLSILLVVAATAVAAGLGPVLIAVVFILVCCVTIPALSWPEQDDGGGARLVLGPGHRAWRRAPLAGALLLGVSGLLLGAVLYLLVPRRPDPLGADPTLALGERESRRPDSGAPGRKVGFPTQPTLGDIGRIKRDDRPLLEAQLTKNGRPYDPTRAERRILLLRLRAWDRYDAQLHRWVRSKRKWTPLGRDGWIGPDGDAPVHWRIRTLDFDQSALFLPQLALRIHGPPASRDPLGNVRADQHWPVYDVDAAWAGMRRKTVREFQPYGGDRQLLHIPLSLKTELDAHLPRVDGRHWMDHVDAIHEKFQREFRYTLDLPPALARSGRDPVLGFLELKEGHCELFASAAVLLLRKRGIPARFVGGARLSERIGRGAYRAHYRNAHAWVEIPFRDVGFLAFDFTPPDSRAETPSPSTMDPAEPEPGPNEAQLPPLVDWSDPLDYSWQDQRRLLGNVGAWIKDLPYGILFAALGVLFLGYVLRHSRSPGGTDPLEVTAPPDGSVKTLVFYAHWLRACAKRGHRRAICQTPREFLSTLPKDLSERGGRITAEFERLRYGARG